MRNDTCIVWCECINILLDYNKFLNNYMTKMFQCMFMTDPTMTTVQIYYLPDSYVSNYSEHVFTQN